MGNVMVPPPKMVDGRSVLEAQFFQYGSVKRDLTEKEKEKEDLPEKAKEDLRRDWSSSPRRVWSSSPTSSVPSDARVSSDDRVSSDVRSIAKYATAKYGSTLARLTKYAVTVGEKMSMPDLNRVFESLSSSQLAKPIQDTANLKNGSSIKTKRGSTWRNLRSSSQCAILKEFRRDRCDFSEFSEKALACSTHAADCGLSASTG
jgi:hypothetical protein